MCLCGHIYKLGRGLEWESMSQTGAAARAGTLSRKGTATAAVTLGTFRGPTRKARWTPVRESGHAELRSVAFGWAVGSCGRLGIEGQAILPVRAGTVRTVHCTASPPAPRTEPATQWVLRETGLKEYTE